MDLPDGLSYQTLVKQVREGKVSQAAIDQAVRYVLDMKFRSGLFENPYADVATAEAITNDADARALALEAAQKSIVLLKNDGLLPLKPTGTRSEERRVGKEWVSTCRSRWSPKP